MSARREGHSEGAGQVLVELFALAWSLFSWFSSLLIMGLASLGLLFVEILREAREPIPAVAGSTFGQLAPDLPEILEAGAVIGFVWLLLVEALSFCMRGRAAVGIRIPPRWVATVRAASSVFHHR